MVKTLISVAPVIEQIVKIDVDSVGHRFDGFARQTRLLFPEEFDTIQAEIIKWVQLSREFNEATSTNNQGVYDYCGCSQFEKVMVCGDMRNMDKILLAQARLRDYKLKMTEFFKNRQGTQDLLIKQKKVNERSMVMEKNKLEMLKQELENSGADPNPKALSVFSRIR